MASKKSYQLSIKKSNEAEKYDVYLGNIKLDFQVGRHPTFTGEASEAEALDLAACFIVKMAKSFAQSRKNKQKKEAEGHHG